MSDFGELVELESRKPHVTINVGPGRVHVIPLSVFERIARGEMAITDLDDWQETMAQIVEMWLDHERKRL